MMNKWNTIYHKNLLKIIKEINFKINLSKNLDKVRLYYNHIKINNKWHKIIYKINRLIINNIKDAKHKFW